MRRIDGGLVWAFVFGAGAWALATMLRPLVGMALGDPGKDIVVRTAVHVLADLLVLGPAAGLLALGVVFVCAERLSGAELQIHAGELGRSLLPRTPQFAFVGVLVWIAAYVSFVLPAMVFSLVLWTLPTGDEATGFTSFLQLGATMLFALAGGAVLAIVVTSRVILAIPIIVEEHLPFKAAVRASLHLSKKRTRELMSISFAAAAPFIAAEIASRFNVRVTPPVQLQSLFEAEGASLASFGWLIAAVLCALFGGIELARAYGRIAQPATVPLGIDVGGSESTRPSN